MAQEFRLDLWRAETEQALENRFSTPRQAINYF
jgi:hypothetical protein